MYTGRNNTMRCKHRLRVIVARGYCQVQVGFSKLCSKRKYRHYVQKLLELRIMADIKHHRWGVRGTHTYLSGREKEGRNQKE